MKISSDYKILLRPASMLLAVLFTFCWVGELNGQAELKWLNVGSYWNKYSGTGMEPEIAKWDFFIYPGIGPTSVEAQHTNRRHLWIGAKDVYFKDVYDSTVFYEYRVAHTGPRQYHLNEFFPKPMILKSRFAAPRVTVDGLNTFKKSVTIDEIDPTIKADRILIREANTVLGITMKNTVRQFSQEYHDSYHIQEYIFTNTGNLDADDIPDTSQTLKDVIISMSNKYQYRILPISGKGTNSMVDVFGDGYVDANGNDHDEGLPYRLTLVWHGAVPWDMGSSLGQPLWNDEFARIAEGDSLGRLAASEFTGRAYLHVDASPTDHSDDPNQPSRMGVIKGGDPITRDNDAWDEKKCADEYAYIHPEMEYIGSYSYKNGHEQPHHADMVAGARQVGDTWYDQMAAQTDMPSLGHSGGWVPTWTIGPYTLEPDDYIRVVFLEGYAGLDLQAQVDIGRAYKLSSGDDEALIDYKGFSQTKNMWVLSGRDSMFQLVDRATDSFNNNYNIPQPPRPPEEFRVISSGAKIVLEWDTFNDVNPPGGFEIYRARYRYQGWPADDFQYQRIVALGGSVRSYEDTTSLERGVGYYYYLQSVGDVNTDNTGLTPTGVRLKSSRYYTQTYDPAYSLRGPGEILGDVRVVPNPYNLGSSQDVRWPDQQDKIGFLDIPGQCTIGIYTELGELIYSVDHTDDTGDEYWNLTTSSNQLVVSGIYFVVIQDKDTGDQIIRKFVVIR